MILRRSKEPEVCCLTVLDPDDDVSIVEFTSQGHRVSRTSGKFVPALIRSDPITAATSSCRFTIRLTCRTPVDAFPLLRPSRARIGQLSRTPAAAYRRSFSPAVPSTLGHQAARSQPMLAGRIARVRHRIRCFVANRHGQHSSQLHRVGQLGVPIPPTYHLPLISGSTQ